MAEIGAEDRLLDQFHRRSDGLNGDDAAILPAESWAVTTDTQIAGTHFPADLDPAQVARRLLVVNLSDMAAMGAQPAFALLVLAAPTDYDHQRFLEAFEAACLAADMRLAGGDLSSSDQVTAVATLFGRQVPSGRWLRRDGARAGHCLWLGGNVGESALGLRLVSRGAQLANLGVESVLHKAAAAAVCRHLEPTPQLELGQWLAEQPEGGALDISDGLGKDLARLCRASGVGAEIHSAHLPEPIGFKELCRTLEVDPLRTKLGGGEDYVLLFSLPKGLEPPSRFGCNQIGKITDTLDLILVDQGQGAPLPTFGWDHLETDRRKSEKQ